MPRPVRACHLHAEPLSRTTYSHTLWHTTTMAAGGAVPSCCCVQETASYKAAFSKLRHLKAEIEHRQLLLEQGRKRLQHDFQQWLLLVASQQQQEVSQAAEHAPESGSISRPSTARRCGRSASTRSSNSSRGAANDCGVQHSAEPSRVASSSQPCTAAPGALLARSVSSAASTSAPAKPGGWDVASVAPHLLQAAAPHLTGNAEADADVVRFFEARDKLLQLKLRAAGTLQGD